MYRIASTAVIITVLGFTPVQAAEIDPAAYPELAQDVLLPPILAELHRTLNDPYSIRDFVMCPARGIKLKNNRPVRWVVSISFNAKNEFGGYTGVRTYAAVFKDGHISGGIGSTQFAKLDGLEGLINNMVAKRMAACPNVPDAKVQQLLTGSIYR